MFVVLSGGTHNFQVHAFSWKSFVFMGILRIFSDAILSVEAMVVQACRNTDTIHARLKMSFAICISHLQFENYMCHLELMFPT